MAANTIDYVPKPGATLKSAAKDLYGDENMYGFLQNNGITALTPGKAIKAPVMAGQNAPGMTASPRDAMANSKTPAQVAAPAGSTIGGVVTPVPLSTSATNVPVSNQEVAAITGVQRANIPAPMGRDTMMQGGAQAFTLLDKLKSGQVSVNQVPTTQAEKEAFLMYESFNKFKDADAKTLLTAIQNGELTPDPSNVLWRAISPDGKATKAMAQAYAMWEQQSSTGYTGNRKGDPFLGGEFPGKVGSQEEANALLNRDEALEGEVMEPGEEAIMRAEKMFNDAMSIKGPAAPNYQQSLQDLRRDFSVNTLEADVNSLSAQLAELEAMKRQRVQANMDQPVTMGVIAGRVNEVERQENERIDAINRQINAKVNQMNTANNTIGMMMEAKKLDYGIAKEEYETKMANTIKMMDQFRQINNDALDFEQAERKRVQDQASANLTTYYNAITEGQMDTSKITPIEAMQIRSMELEAGMPAGTFLNLRSTKPTSEVKTQVARVEANGDKYFDIIMQDRFTNKVTISSVYAGKDSEAALNMDVDRSTIAKNSADALMAPLDREYKQAQINKTNLSSAADYKVEGGGLSTKPTITGQYGAKYGKGIEATADGKNIGTDFAVPVGTSVAVPPGEWTVIDAKTGVKGGNIKDYKSQPYGNSVLLQNAQGEKIRLSHLSEVNVSNGSKISGGQVIGKSGATGNVTGPHLDVEYRTAKGGLADIMGTDYGKYYASGGTVKKNTTTETGSKKDMVSQLKQDIQDDALLGGDGKMDPDNYNLLKKSWMGEGHSATEFDNMFGQYINKSQAAKYELGTVNEQIKKAEEGKKKAEEIKKAAMDSVLNALPVMSF